MRCTPDHNHAVLPEFMHSAPSRIDLSKKHDLQCRFKPKRTAYLAFGHDEEVGGAYGASAIAQELHSQGVVPEVILDEGGVLLVDGIKPITSSATAVIGVAEKVWALGWSQVVECMQVSSPVPSVHADIQALDSPGMHHDKGLAACFSIGVHHDK